MKASSSQSVDSFPELVDNFEEMTQEERRRASQLHLQLLMRGIRDLEGTRSEVKRIIIDVDPSGKAVRRSS